MTEEKIKFINKAENSVTEMPQFKTDIRNIEGGIPLHWHKNIEIEIVLKGKGYHIHNGNRTELKKGQVYILRVNDYHEFHYNAIAQILNISISEQALPKDLLFTLNTIPSSINVFLDDDNFELLMDYTTLCENEKNLKVPNKHYIKYLLEGMCIFILRQSNFDTAPTTRAISINHFNTALVYLHEHFREEISLKHLADISNYTPNHFSAVFHKEMGKTLWEYLNDLRIKYAKQLLTTTDLKVIDVGFQSGFNSYNSFYSTFRKHCTLSPAKYKAQYKKIF